jgi:hypothetical protein
MVGGGWPSDGSPLFSIPHRRSLWRNGGEVISAKPALNKSQMIKPYCQPEAAVERTNRVQGQIGTSVPGAATVFERYVRHRRKSA